MKLINKLKASVVTAVLLGTITLASASSFDNVNSNGLSFGKISKNVSSGLVDGASMFEAFLYLMAIVFLTFFILTLVKHKKSDGREGSPALIGIYLLAAVCCFGAPTLLGGGLSTIFGTGAVTTVKPPTANIVGN